MAVTNYDIEEISLLKKQFFLSIFSIISIFVSLSLTYNEILKRQEKETIYSKKTRRKILIYNRLLALAIFASFLWINIEDRKIKNYYGQDDLKAADIQISASILALIGAVLVLYASVISISGDISEENPII